MFDHDVPIKKCVHFYYIQYNTNLYCTSDLVQFQLSLVMFSRLLFFSPARLHFQFFSRVFPSAFILLCLVPLDFSLIFRGRLCSDRYNSRPIRSKNRAIAANQRRARAGLSVTKDCTVFDTFQLLLVTDSSRLAKIPSIQKKPKFRH